MCLTKRINNLFGMGAGFIELFGIRGGLDVLWRTGSRR